MSNRHFVVDYRDLANVKVSEHPTSEAAGAACPSEGGALVVSSEADLKRLEGPILVAIYNRIRRSPAAVKRFATKDDAVRRVITLLEAYDPALVNPAAAAHPEPKPAQQQEDTLAKTAKKSKAKKEKTARAPRGVGKPAGKVSDLNPIREGTARQKVLKAMSLDGGSTVAQAAARAGITEAMVMQHAYCLHRDCGIGYQVVDGKLRALYPGDRTYDDVVKKTAG